MRRALRAVPVIAIALALTTAALAAPGDLDPSFSGDGLAVVDFRNGGQGFAAARGDDGTFVIGGHAGMRLALARLLPGGGPDPTFGGGDGRVTLPLGEGYAQVNDVFVMDDGRILVSAFGVRNGQAAFHVLRLRVDGGRDRTFSGDGLAVTGFPDGPATPWGTALQPDGAVVVTGAAGPSAAVVRYLSDGTLDRTFDVDGVRTFSVGLGAPDVGADVAIGPDGDIVVVGTADEGSGIFTARLTPGGALDRTFGADGWSLARDLGDDVRGSAVAVRPNGQIVVGGTVAPVGRNCCEMVLLVYGIAGGRIPTFGGGDGIQALRPAGGWSFLSAISLASGGRIVAVGGGGAAPERQDLVVARVGPDGTPDATFGGDGLAVIQLAGEEAGYGLGLDTDGDVLVGGTRLTLGTYRFLAARVQGS